MKNTLKNTMVEFDLLISRNSIYELSNIKGIYVLLSDGNIPIYVGQSVNIKYRLASHLSGNYYILSTENVERVYNVGIILCENVNNLDEIEQKFISLLKPILNIDKVDYIKEIDITTLKKHGPPYFQMCKHVSRDEVLCGKISTREGYCYYHDPKGLIYNTPSWIMPRKLITTEIQRLIFEIEYSRQPLYLYMNNVTFGKLVSEKTFATIDYINEETILKFKKHFIIIDEDETIRIETTKRPYNIF